MSRLQTLNIKVRRSEPLIWIERLVIYETLQPSKEIRAIPFHRGLNIVWAKQDDEEQPGPTEIAGHSAGKTTLCRLLRYCLGETRFGTAEKQKLIRDNLRDGHVAAEVRVGGTRWAVLRPIGSGNRHYAVENATIEQLLDQRTQENGYERFLDAVNKAVIGPMPIKRIPRTNTDVQWLHLLAWAARDQEARFQEIWHWRSPRSDSETPAFQREKVDALLLMRSLLGLLTGNEVKLENELAVKEARQKEMERELADARKEPEYWVAEITRSLKKKLGVNEAEAITFDSPNLFEDGLSELVEDRVRKLNVQIDALDKELVALDREWAQVRGRLVACGRIITKLKPALDHTDGAAREMVEYLESEFRDSPADSVDPLSECPASQKLLQDTPCWQIYMDRIAGKEGSFSFRDAAANAVGQSQLDEKTTRQGALHESLAVRLQQAKDLRSQLAALDADRKKQHDDRAEKEATKKDLNDLLTKFQNWTAVAAGTKEHTKIRKLTEDMTGNKHDCDSLGTRLSMMMQSHQKVRKRLNDLFDGMVKAVVSKHYTGIVKLSDEQLSFDIRHGATLGGEAVGTLCVLLTDLTALILAAEEASPLPGLLIHDSPREADLSRHLYWNLLHVAQGMQTHVAGADGPAFQYIVTTTTPPPDELRRSGAVVDELSAHDEGQMLFCRVLVDGGVSQQTIAEES